VIKAHADVTIEELKARVSLYESWLRAIDTQLRCDFWFKDVNSRYLHANEQFCDIIGFDRARLEGSVPEDLFNAERAERVRLLDRKVMEEGGFTRVIPCGRDGSFEMHEEHRFPVYDHEQNIVGLGCLAFEVTESSVKEQALQLAEQLAEIGYWRWSISGNCLLACSDQFASLLGCDMPEAFSIMRDRISAVVHQDDRERVRSVMERLSAEGAPYSIDYRLVRADGEVRYVQEIARAVAGGDGKVAELVGTLQDVTQRKKVELELLEIKRDLEEKVHARTASLQYIADHDYLTGAINRYSVVDRFNSLVRRCRRSHPCIATVSLDIAGFKYVNECYGQQIGDSVLSRFCQLLKESFPSESLVARLGGDEFLVVFAGDEDIESNVTLWCGLVARQLERAFFVDNVELSLSLNAGVHIGMPHDVQYDDAQRSADLAREQARLTAGFGFVIFSESMMRAAQRRTQLVSDLPTAIRENGLTLAYQRQHNTAADASCVVYEVLARWTHHNEGCVSPDEFIELAESRGLMSELGQWVIDQSCRDYAALQALHAVPIRLSINLSPQQFQSDTLLRGIESSIDAAGLSHDNFEYEITESLLIRNFESTGRLLSGLRQLGSRILLDDFGTGFASLSYLREFPIDGLKLDKSFIDRITEKREDRVIVEGVVSMARSLGIEIVAEGVEAPEQARMLSEMGCDRLQGYLYARPEPLAKLCEGVAV